MASNRREGKMITARIGTIATLHHDAHRRFAEVLRALHAKFIEAGQRKQERRMLAVGNDLDHPGVLADMEAACRQSRRPRAFRD
jgi:hypothetical protein